MTLPSGFLARPFAHRALHDVQAGRPENSRAAVAAAIQHGYGIEIDLQLSRDGVAMVFHDYDLGRLTEVSGALAQRDAAELAALPLRHGNEGIPTLVEILDLVAGQVPLVIEIKDQDGILGPNVGALEAACAADLQRYSGAVAVMSFNPHSVWAMAECAPDLPRGLVTDSFDPEDWLTIPETRRAELRRIEDAHDRRVDFISHRWQVLDTPAVAALQKPKLCWTIRSAQAAATALTHADAITFEGFLP